MLKGSEVIGKPIVSFDTGAMLRRIQDVIFDVVNNRVIAFLVDEGGVFARTKVVPFSKIKATGPDAVTVDSKSAVINAKEDEGVQNALDSNHAIKGTRVLTEDGKYLGTITDLFFNEHSGTIEGFEISGGLLGDAMRGKSFLPSKFTLKLGKHVVFVSHDTMKVLDQQIGGLQGMVRKAGDKVAEAREQAVPHVQNAFESASDAVSSSMGIARDKVADGKNNAKAAAQGAAASMKGKIQNFSDGQLIGKTAARTVRTDTGNIIVAEGQLVTSEMVGQSRAENKFLELAAAIGLVALDDVQSKASSVANVAGKNVAQGAQAAGEGLRDAYLGIRDRFVTYRNRAAKKLEERRIQNAIGKPVTKVIYDKQDNIILNTGDLITHQSVSLAREAGMLESLLGAVSTDKPSFTKEELKAQPS